MQTDMVALLAGSPISAEDFSSSVSVTIWVLGHIFDQAASSGYSVFDQLYQECWLFQTTFISQLLSPL